MEFYDSDQEFEGYSNSFNEESNEYSSSTSSNEELGDENVTSSANGKRNVKTAKSDEKEQDYEKTADKVALAFKNRVYSILKELSLGMSSEFADGGKLQGPPITALDIEGVGKVSFPIYEGQAKSVIKALKQSPFGKKFETVIDTSVRNSWQLNPQFFKIVNSGWESYLSATILPLVRKGMEIESPIEATLYKLLMYEPGSFFKPHSDTEKQDRMFGTLVVQLPSDYCGGELVVNHGGKTKRFDFSSGHPNSCGDELSMFYAAFYCDCQHEILPVTKGYRVCLVYNLVVAGSYETPIIRNIDKHESNLIKAIKQWPKSSSTKLVYVLSHKYTEASLSIENLKNPDRGLVRFLRDVGEKHSLVVHLALLTRHVVGSCEGYGRRPRKIKLEGGCEEYHYSLNKWVSLDGTKKDFKNWDVCVGNELIPTNCFHGDKPDKETYQEYTGNEGATAERWYHRAVVVFWPTDTTFAVMKASGASQDLLFQIFLDRSEKIVGKSRRSAEWKDYIRLAKILVSSQEGQWHSFSAKKELTFQVLQCFVSISDLSLLQQFLDKISNQTTDNMIPLLSSECDKHGWSKLLPQLSRIVIENHRYDLNKAGSLLLVLVTQSNVNSEDKKNSALQLVKSLIDLKCPQTKYSFNYKSFSPADEKKFLSNMFRVCCVVNFDLSEYIFSKQSPEYVMEIAVPVLLNLHESEPEIASNSNWTCLANRCTLELEVTASKDLETSNWGRVDLNMSCPCEDCRTLETFLKKNLESIRLQMPVKRRNHLIKKLRGMLGIVHTIDRTCSPHALIVTKTIVPLLDKEKKNKLEATDFHKKLKDALTSKCSDVKPEPLPKMLKLQNADSKE